MENPRENVLNIGYMKMMRRCLSIISGWPNLNQYRQSSLLKPDVIYIIIQVIVIIGEITYLYQNFGVVEFLLIADLYLITFMTLISLARLCLPYFKSYYTICKSFVTEFHLIYYKHKGEIFKEILLRVDEISFYCTVFLIGTLISGTIIFNLSPMYVNVKNGAFTTTRDNLHNISLQFTVNYKYPGYNQKDYFYITTIINIYLSFLCTVSIVSIDILLILMIFQILGHLEILSRNMQSVPKPKSMDLIKNITEDHISIYGAELYDAEENVEIRKILKDFVVHHNLIISFTDNVSALFGPVLGFNYLFHLLSLCLLLLECTQGKPDTIFRFIPLAIYVLLQLIQTSVIFEIINSKSIALIDSVYSLPWECMSVENQRIVYFMLCRVQKPVQMVAFGLVGVGVQTMANILKTTFSYYTFLQTL